MTHRHTFFAAVFLSAAWAGSAFGQGMIPSMTQELSPGSPLAPSVMPSQLGGSSLFDPASPLIGSTGSAIPSYGVDLLTNPDQPLSTNPSIPGGDEIGMIDVRCVTAEGYCEFQSPDIVAPGTPCFCNGSSSPGITQ